MNTEDTYKADELSCIKDMSHPSSSFVDSGMVIYTSNSTAGFTPEITQALKRHFHCFCHTTTYNVLSSKLLSLIEYTSEGHGQTEVAPLTDFSNDVFTHTDRKYNS